MKRITAVILILILSLSVLSACSSSNEGSSKASGTLIVNIWDSNQQAGLQKIAENGRKLLESRSVSRSLTGTTTGHFWKLVLLAVPCRMSSGHILILYSCTWTTMSC